MKHSNYNILPVIAAALLLFGCGGNGNKSQVKLSPIMEKALNEKNSKFYADFGSFPKERAKLPIGVFDSGTGGLTVLEVLLKNDMVNNVTGEDGQDGIPDLAGENFKGKITDYSARFFGLCEDCLKETKGNSDSSK